MRHKVSGRKFDRNTGSRKALFRNLITQFFKHDRIVTTEAKAKEVRRLAEKLITKAKKEDLHARRQVLRVINDKGAVKRLFDVILAKVSNRNTGGYTRLIKIGNRKGDDAPMALLEILEPGTGQAKPKKGLKKKGAAKAKAKAKKEKAKEKTKEKPAAPKKAVPEEKETITEKVKPISEIEESPSEESPIEEVKPTSEDEEVPSEESPSEEESQGTTTEKADAQETQTPPIGEEEITDDSQSTEKEEPDSETETEPEAKAEEEKKEDS
jgi:large subunit ribosomal protein L17